METFRLGDFLTGVSVGLIFGAWFAIDAMTYELNKQSAHPCKGCAKKLQKEVNTDD